MQLTLEQKMFNLLTQIPKGKVTTYKLLAQAVGVLNPRQIGVILHGNKDPHKFPCYKVVRSDGTIAEGYAFGGQKEQIKKLEKDGITFLGKKVNLDHHLFTSFI